MMATIPRRYLLLLPLLFCDPNQFTTLYAKEVSKPELPAASKTVLTVGQGKKFRLPSMAAQVARDGDLVEIDAGIYEKDAAVWRQNNLTIRAVGNGRAHLKADGVNAEGKAIWVIKGNNVTIENIEFSGARVDDQNGAGIRLEGIGLTVRHCYFHDSETGILGGSNPENEVLVEYTEFARNGSGDGSTHNIYVGEIKSFTLQYSYSHHAIVGHTVKSRARRNLILYNRIMDEADGRASYLVDICNGGQAFLIGNLIEQGPKAENFTIISYGAEGLKSPVNELYVANNTIVNHRENGGIFVFVKAGTTAARLINNIFVGRGTVLEGPGEQQNNLVSEKAGLANPGAYDFHLTQGSPAIDGGVAPGSAAGFDLQPRFEYVHPLQKRPRPVVDKLDIGAYEFVRSGAATSR